MKQWMTVVCLVGSLLALVACGQEAAQPEEASLSVGEGDVTKVEPGKADSSAEAVFVDMTFEGSLLTDRSWNPQSQIEDQLLYTIGHLNGDRAVGRLDKIKLEDVKVDTAGQGTLVSYRATLQVAWGKKDQVPATYDFILPRDVSYKGLEAFTEAYSHDCVDWGAHDVTAGSMWYYYRPNQPRCSLEEQDVVRSTATVEISQVNTTGKYPEYDKVWEDGVFQVVAVFGKYEDGATSNDAGIDAYNNFSRLIAGVLSPHDLKTVPEELPYEPGVEVPELSFEAQLDQDHRVVVHAIMVDNVRTAGADFDARYAELSTKADFIVYNGHAGLGANIRALAQKGHWEQGQYAIVFMNGCDTYAYVDSALFDAHAAVNPDDPQGTRHLDLVTNALPSFFSSMPRATMALISALLHHQNPLNYEQIFKDIDASQVVLVSGEQDNTFLPGGGGQPDAARWAGLEVDGEVARGQERRFDTGVLAAGSYTFLMEGSGDADLYLRVGLAPDEQSFDCRPYKSGSSESCKIELAAPTTLHGLVRGWAPSSTFTVVGSAD